MMDKKELIEIAKQTMLKAYAPYSNLKVGAALLSNDGQIFTGCNIENASYGISICAERVAIIKAISEGCREFSQLAVIANTKEPCSPCGFCRQILFEFNPDMPILMANLQGEILEVKVKELLPLAFKKE